MTSPMNTPTRCPCDRGSRIGSHGTRINRREAPWCAQAAQHARDLRVTSLVDLCRAATIIRWSTSTKWTRGHDPCCVVDHLSPRSAWNAANKVLLDAYMEAPATWRSFAAIKSAGDFKDHTGVRPSQTGDLDPVAPGGELTHGSMKEATISFPSIRLAR